MAPTPALIRALPCPLTAGRVAVPGGEDRWSVFRSNPPSERSFLVEDDCGSAAAVARALCRTYLGAPRAHQAAERALERAGC